MIITVIFMAISMSQNTWIIEWPYFVINPLCVNIPPLNSHKWPLLMWQLLAIFWKRLSQLDVESHMSSSPCVVAKGYFQKSTQDAFHLSNCLPVQYICFSTTWKMLIFSNRGRWPIYGRRDLKYSDKQRVPCDAFFENIPPAPLKFPCSIWWWISKSALFIIILSWQPPQLDKLTQNTAIIK